MRRGAPAALAVLGLLALGGCKKKTRAAAPVDAGLAATPVLTPDAAPLAAAPVNASMVDAEPEGSCMEPKAKVKKDLPGTKLTIEVEDDVGFRQPGVPKVTWVELSGGYWMEVAMAPGLTLEEAKKKLGDDTKIVRAEETPYGFLVTGMSSTGMEAIAWRKDLGVSCAANNGHDEAPTDYGTCYLAEIVAACTSLAAK